MIGDRKRSINAPSGSWNIVRISDTLPAPRVPCRPVCIRKTAAGTHVEFKNKGLYLFVGHWIDTTFVHG